MLTTAWLHTCQTLSKTYTVEPEDEVVPKKFVGCKINWKDPSLDVTVEQVQILAGRSQTSALRSVTVLTRSRASVMVHLNWLL